MTTQQPLETSGREDALAQRAWERGTRTTAPYEIRIGVPEDAPSGSEPPSLPVNLVLGATVTLLGVGFWQAGLRTGLAAFVIVAGAAMVAGGLLARGKQRPADATAMLLAAGSLVVRTERRDRVFIKLADVRELLLWRSDFPGAASTRRTDAFDVLVLSKRPWQDLSPRARRSLRQAPWFFWGGPKCLHAEFCDRPLIDVAALLATHIELTSGTRPTVAALTASGDPTPIDDLPSMSDWQQGVTTTRPELPAGARCLTCGYDLRGFSRDAVCPECGTPVTRSDNDFELSAADALWRARVRRGAALVWSGGFVASAAAGAAFFATMTAPKPVPTMYGPAVVACTLLGLMLPVIAAGGWLMLTKEPGEAHPATRNARKYARLLWLFPLVVPGIAWACSASGTTATMVTVAAALVPTGRLLIYTGVLLSRAKQPGWSKAALEEGAFAAFGGIIATCLILQPFVMRFLPVLPRPTGGGPAPGPVPPAGPNALVASPILQFVLHVILPLFLVMVGIALWAPVFRLWKELRAIERQRDSAELKPIDSGQQPPSVCPRSTQ